MSPIAILVLCLLLTGLTLTRVVFAGKWLNPITALFFPHILLLISYQLALNARMFGLELSTKAWVLLSSAYCSYAVGVVAVCLISVGPAQIKSRQLFDLVEVKQFYKTTIFLLGILFVGVALKYFKILSTYGNPISNIIQIRSDYVADVLKFGLANSTSFFSSLLIMINLGILIGSGKAKVRWLVSSSIALAILNDFTTGGAYWSFLGFCMLFISLYVTRGVSAGLKEKKGNPCSVFALAIIPVVMALLLFFRTGGKYGTEESIYDLFVTYMGGNIASFGYFIEDPGPISSGLSGSHVFGGLYGLANRSLSLFNVGFLPISDPDNGWANIGIPWNTSIHFAYYYADFGRIGLFLISGAVGLLAGAVYIKMVHKPSLLRIQYCAVVFYMVLVSVRCVPSEGQYFWILLVSLPAINAWNRFWYRKENNRIPVSSSRRA